VKMRIEVEYLSGTVYASDGLNQPEWPPHPARLFSAMVNAAKQAELGESADDALRWLEQQRPPSIRSGEPGDAVVVTRFVPPNYPRFREPYQMLPWFRDSAKQQRMFPSQTPSDPVVSFEWPGIDSYPAALPEIVRRIARLGHSASFVRASVETDGVEPTFVPDSRGPIALRVPTPGRLDELEECYRLDQWPRPAALQRYRRFEPPLAQSGHGEMIVMRQVGGLPIPVEATLTFTEAFRKALIAVADQQGVVTPEIHGHQNGPHCAYVPLPFAGWEHSNGRLLGAALVMPRGAGILLQHRIYRACAALKHIEVPAFGSWQPGPVRVPAPMTLQPSTWIRPARTWATITPIVLKHRPSQKFDRPLEKTVAEYCVAAGLPRPIEVRVGRYPFLPSVPRAYDFRLRRKAAEPEERFATHAWIRFDRLVEGPVLLGKLRHFGLGLLRPVEGSRNGD
jgi:CRISPR-associated protein Csb2